MLKGAGVQFGGGYLATAADYQGYFESSSADLNKMYYAGAYTEQTDMQPAGVNGAAQPSVLDGAKRDRAIWSGDLGIEGQGIADTLGQQRQQLCEAVPAHAYHEQPAGRRPRR